MSQALNLMRSMALLVVAVIAVAGCADPDAGGAETTATTVTTVASETTTTAVEESTTTLPSEVTVQHSQGEATVPFQPQTVVVFEYAALDTLDALGVEITGVVKGTLPSHLQGYASDDFENVGTLFEPDYELINSLEPDLIIIGGRSSATLPEMEAIAPTIDLTYEWVDPMTDIEAHTRTLGRIFGFEGDVEARLAAINARLTEVQTASASGGTALIVLTSAGEVTAYGPGSRFGIVHDVLGVAPAVENVEEATHGEAISFEFILEANPSILYVVDRDAAIGAEGEAAAQVLDNELVHQTEAWQEDRVFYVDAGAWYLSFGGLTSIETLISEVASSLE